MASVDIYNSMIQSFVEDNTSLFQNAKVYEKSYDSGDIVYKYIPDRADKEDPSFIGNKEVFENLFTKFKDVFLFNSNIIFDLKGHFNIKPDQNLSNSDSHIVSNFYRLLKWKMTLDLFYVYLHSIGKKEKSKMFMFMFGDDIIEFQSGSSCRKCGTDVATIINLKTLTVEPFLDTFKPCPFPNKVPSSIKVNLKAPSKKLVFLNNPSDFINLEREDQYECSINCLLGVIKETEMYAEHNIGYFFVGNTGLSEFKKDNEILFANYDESSAIDQKKYSNHTYKGYVCMDLWWYTVLDFDLFNKLCSEKSINTSDIRHIVVDIEGENVSITHSHKAFKGDDYYGTHSRIKIK